MFVRARVLGRLICYLERQTQKGEGGGGATATKKTIRKVSILVGDPPGALQVVSIDAESRCREGELERSLAVNHTTAQRAVEPPL